MSDIRAPPDFKTLGSGIRPAQESYELCNLTKKCQRFVGSLIPNVFTFLLHGAESFLRS